MKDHPVTPDGRYFVVKGRLWRRSNPALSAEDRQRLVDALMRARRSVRDALRRDDIEDLKAARQAVQTTKVALGERGPPWWSDGAVDLNRRMAINSPYADWYRSLDKD